MSHPTVPLHAGTSMFELVDSVELNPDVEDAYVDWVFERMYDRGVPEWPTSDVGWKGGYEEYAQDRFEEECKTASLSYIMTSPHAMGENFMGHDGYLAVLYQRFPVQTARSRSRSRSFDRSRSRERIDPDTNTGFLVGKFHEELRKARLMLARLVHETNDPDLARDIFDRLYRLGTTWWPIASREVASRYERFSNERRAIQTGGYPPQLPAEVSMMIGDFLDPVSHTRAQATSRSNRGFEMRRQHVMNAPSALDLMAFLDAHEPETVPPEGIPQNIVDAIYAELFDRGVVRLRMRGSYWRWSAPYDRYRLNRVRADCEHLSFGQLLSYHQSLDHGPIMDILFHRFGGEKIGAAFIRSQSHVYEAFENAAKLAELHSEDTELMHTISVLFKRAGMRWWPNGSAVEGPIREALTRAFERH